MYYEYWVAFDQIDKDGDKRLTFKEFKWASPQLTNWGIDMSNPQAQWKKCDADGHGKVLFDEFCNWAISQSLDLDDDDDEADSVIDVQDINRRDATQERLKKYKRDNKAKTQEKHDAGKKKYDNKIWAELK